MNKEILKKISLFQGKFAGIKKNRKNDYTESRYASLDDVMREAGPVLVDCGLFVTQPLIVRDGLQILQTIIYDSEGNEGISEMNLGPMCPKEDAQRVGSAVTYARRYSLCSILNIIEMDDDGNGATVDTKLITKDQTKKIHELIEQTGTDKKKVLAHIESNGWGKALEELTYKQAAQIIGILRGKK